MDTTHEHQENAVQGGTQKHAGSCHCGAVRFEVELDMSEVASRCNCSICTKLAMTGRIVKPSAFTLLSGEEGLGAYAWGGKTSQRFFCKHCGIHAFARGHLEQVGGDYVSINVNCLDNIDPNGVNAIYWDGRHNNWQAGPRDAPWPILVEPSRTA
jgi:hypothetical protein